MRGRTALSAQPCNGVLDDNDGDDNHENDNDDARRETIMWKQGYLQWTYGSASSQ